MPRNESAGKMSAAGGGVIQPGRVMLLLRDAMVDDELVYQIAAQCGDVKNVHRPPSNRQLVFVQYEDPSCTEHAIAQLKRLPIFRGVDPAIKSDRFINDKSSGGGGNNNNSGSSNNTDDQQQRNMKNQHNKGGAQRQQQRGGGNNANYNNMNGNGGNDFNDVSYSSMESSSPQKPQDSYQPKFSLGCWSCTKMPSFECRCGAFYCGPECQRTDWPTHKDICMPRLVPISYSNQRILQEATASKQSSMSSNAPFSQDLISQQQNRRGQTTAGNNNNNNQSTNQPKNQNKDNPRQQQPRNQNKDSPRQQQQQQQPKPSPPTPRSSPVEASAAADDKVSRVANKLQRLKIAKSVVGTAAAATTTPAAKGVLLPGVFPREGSLVRITASLPAGVAYIYHNNGTEGGQYSDYYLLTNRIIKATAEAKPLTAVPSVDDIIFAPFMGGFYRAKVISVDGEKLAVFFVDFGNSDTVQWKQSREIADGDLKWAKYLTFPVALEGVDAFTPEMMKFLEALEHVEEFKLVKAEPGKGAISVVLKRPKLTLTLNMELIEIKERELRLRKEREEQKEREKKQEQEKKLKQVRKVEIKPADPSNYQPVLFDESMDTKQLPMGGPKRLLIIDASEVLETRIISVLAFEEVETYAAVLDQCNEAGGADPNVYKPTDEGEVCLVLYQEDWSRALYDISDGTFMLLDVGIITSVTATNVRRFPSGLSRVIYNNEVFVENLPKLKGLMKDDKPDSVHGMPIDAKIAATEDGVSITIIDSAVARDS